MCNVKVFLKASLPNQNIFNNNNNDDNNNNNNDNNSDDNNDNAPLCC